jgi:hypothetical protein
MNLFLLPLFLFIATAIVAAVTEGGAGLVRYVFDLGRKTAMKNTLRVFDRLPFRMPE